MASVTLVEAAKLAQDDLVAGIIETLITVNPMFEVIPMDGIDGNALAYNRENVAGDTQVLNVGGTITAKAAATFTQVTSRLTTIIGDAEVNGLVQATRSSDGNDQTAVQVASKAKSAARQWQDMFINGDSGATAYEFDGLITLCDTDTQTISSTGDNGDALTFLKMDNGLDLVIDRDGQVDFITTNARTIRVYKQLLRGLGGASINEVIELPSGTTIPVYSGVGIFRNDWVAVDEAKGTGSDLTSVFIGNFDDGSRDTGCAGITAMNAAGVVVEDVGVHQSRDERITRVKWYCGLALFSELGLSRISELTGAAS